MPALPGRRVLALLGAVLLAAPAAGEDRAPGAVSDELGVASGASSPDVPRNRQVSDTLSASIPLADAWTLDLDAGATVIAPTKGVAGEQYGHRGGTVLFFEPGLEWDATEQLTLALSLFLSPESRQLTDTTLQYQSAGKTEQADALLSVRSSSRGARTSADWETGGSSSLETALSAGLEVTRFDAEQRVVATRASNGTSVPDAELQAYCQTHACSRQLLGLLRGEATPLVQVVARAGITETLLDDTDAGLTVAWYAYDRDPTQVGFFGLTAAGRGPGFGSGLPLAPLRWTVAPELARRLGPVTVSARYEHGAYVDAEGAMDLVGGEVRLRLGEGVRTWISASVQRDRDAGGSVSTFAQGAVGLKVLF